MFVISISHPEIDPNYLRNALVSSPSAILFYALWFGVLLYFGYVIFKSCMSACRQANGTQGAGPGSRGGGRRNGGGGWFSGLSGGGTGTGGPNHDDRPPPYYPKDPAPSNPAPNQGWTPGFWTGLGLGGLAASMWNNGRQGGADTDTRAARRAREELLRQQQAYDWERSRAGSSSSWFGGSSQGSPPRQRYTPMETQSEGAGPSGLGQTRRSTAIGSSRVR